MKKVLSIFLIFIFVLTSTISIFATESSFVTTSDGKSYPGLPPFPTDVGKNYVFTDYILLEKQGDYRLITSIDPVVAYKFTGSVHGMGKVIDAIQTKDSKGYVNNENVYTLIDGSWTSDTLPGSALMSFTDYKILTSSIDIYTDSSKKTVFFKSATDPLVSGLSSTELKKMTLKEITGLIPFVIGFLVVLLAFYKGWRFLLTQLKGA